MRYAIAPSNFGPFGHPRAAAELAATAEAAGWDGYFTWDSLPIQPDGPPAHDPWVVLSAVAMATESIRIGTCVAAVPRYKPHLLALTAASLDRLSGGRLVLGVGIGGEGSAFEAFGEAGDARSRAQRLDEALEIVTRLWVGEHLTFEGRHHRIDGFSLTAPPVQQPRVPIWVGGDSDAALRRAARWDGWIGPDNDPLSATPDRAVEVVARLRSLDVAASFDVAWAGSATTASAVAPYADAGATWWIEPIGGEREPAIQRVAAGPPDRG